MITEAGGSLPPGNGAGGAAVSAAAVFDPELAAGAVAVVAVRVVESEVVFAFLVSGLDPQAVHTRKSMAHDAVTKFFVIVYCCSVFYSCLSLWECTGSPYDGPFYSPGISLTISSSHR